jgi:hypothetical protein
MPGGGSEKTKEIFFRPCMAEKPKPKNRTMEKP